MRTGPNIRLRSDGRWEARYIKAYNHDGRGVYGYCYGRTFEEAEAKRRSELEKINSLYIPGSLTLREVCMLLKTGGGDNDSELFGDSPKKCWEAADKWVLPRMGDDSVFRFSTMMINDYIDGIRAEAGEDEAAAALKFLKGVFDFSVSKGYIRLSPVGISPEEKRRVKEERYFPSNDDYDALTDMQAQQLENELINCKDRKKLGLYLCLKMGLSFSEVLALRFSDIDFAKRTITINKRRQTSGKHPSPDDRFPLRVLPLLDSVYDYLYEMKYFYSSPDEFLIVLKKGVPAHISTLQNELVRINNRIKIAPLLTHGMLRDTFTYKCLICGIDPFSVAKILGIRNVYELVKRFGSCITADESELLKMNVFDIEGGGIVSNSKKNSSALQKKPLRKMNLLILGAGGQGHVVKELAQLISVFNKIDFLDDKTDIPGVLDTCEFYDTYVNEYPVAYPAFGDNKLRMLWMKRLEEAGFMLPKLIHPEASVSPTAKIGQGTVIEAKAIVYSEATVGDGCIISAGAIINHNATVGDGCHVDSGATVMKDNVIESGLKINSGVSVNDR